MIVTIQGRGFSITPALAEYVRRRLESALARHTHHLQRVFVRLGDENGPRGGADKYCRIEVLLRDTPAAVAQDVGADLYATVDRATDRLGRVVVKQIDRSRRTRGPERCMVRLARDSGAGRIPATD
jgi:putative sigma-54 modulation protein